MKFSSDEIDAEVFFLEVPSKLPLPEEVIEGQVNIKARPLTEFEIAVNATGSCFKDLGADGLYAEILLGRTKVGHLLPLKDKELSVKGGWELADYRQRFKTSASMLRYENEDKNCAEDLENSQRVNEIEVRIGRYRSKGRRWRAVAPQRWETSPEVIKREKDERKFFEYASMAFEAGTTVREDKLPDIVLGMNEVKELAVLRAVMEQTYISERRVAHAKRKKEIQAAKKILSNAQEVAIIDLTSLSSDEDSDFEIVQLPLSPAELKQLASRQEEEIRTLRDKCENLEEQVKQLKLDSRSD